MSTEFKEGDQLEFLGYGSGWPAGFTKGAVYTAYSKFGTIQVMDDDKDQRAVYPFKWKLHTPATPEPTQPTDLKFDGDKVRHELLMSGCPKALDGIAKVLTFGATKYEAHSWKTLDNAKERYTGALYRHLNAVEQGEELDPESGLSHMYHVACNALFLIELAEDSEDV